jgi:hypothetical protein
MKKLAILFLTRAILPLRTKCSGGRSWLSLLWPGTSAISASVCLLQEIFSVSPSPFTSTMPKACPIIWRRREGVGNFGVAAEIRNN